MSSSRPVLLFLLFIALAFLLSPAHAADATSAVPKAYNPFDEPRPRIPQEMLDDKRLDVKVKIFVKSKNMKQLFADLSAKTGIKITAARELWGERPIIYFHNRPLRDVLTEVSGLYGYYWLVSGKESAYKYELFEDVKHARRRGQSTGNCGLYVDGLKRFSNGDEGSKLLARMAENNPHVSNYVEMPWLKSLANLLLSFGDDRLCKALTDGGVTVLFNDLPPGAQTAIVDLDKERAKGVTEILSGMGSRLPGMSPRSMDDYAWSTITLSKWPTDQRTSTDMMGNLRMKVSRGDSIVMQIDWPPYALAEDQLRALADRPASEKVLAKPPLPADPQIDATNLRWTASGRVLLLGDVLEAIARGSDWDVIADYYFGTQGMDKVQRRSLNQLVSDVCGRFRYTCQVDGNTMRFRYDNWSAEVPPTEPSAESLGRWWRTLEESGCFATRQVMEIAMLPEAQSAWRGLRFMPGAYAASFMFNRKSTMALWTSLSESQERTARLGSGLPISSLTGGQKDRLAEWLSAMKASPSVDELSKGAIRIERAEFPVQEVSAGGSLIGANRADEDFSVQLPGSRIGPIRVHGATVLSEQDRLAMIAQRKADAEADVIEVLR